MVAMNTALLAPTLRLGAHWTNWTQAGGGAGLARALADPAQLIDLVRDADLRGLGGSGFPVWRKWAALRDAEGSNKYLVVNGNEDEPGTFKDRLLLAETPHNVVEGALIAALATGARHIIFYINPDLPRALSAMENAVRQWRKEDRLAAVAAALGGVDLRVLPASGHYIGGEETAALEWIEGRFPFPRGKPPYPAQSGAWGQPTLINNVETLAHVPFIVRHGVEWFRGQGRTKPGTKLYSLSGDVLYPGVYELPLGITLRELIFEVGGGLLSGRPLKAVFTGGPSNTILTADALDITLDFESVRARKANLGTGAMIVISEGTGIIKRVAEYVRFFAHSSCGQCPPCRNGTRHLSQLLDRIDMGEGTRDDLDTLRNLCRILPGSGRCPLLDGTLQVIDSSFYHFESEYRQAVRG